MENGQFIVDVPIEMVIFRSYVNLPESVSSMKNGEEHMIWKHGFESMTRNHLAELYYSLRLTRK